MAEGSQRMAEGMLSLSWNNHSAAFTQTLATLREKEIYTDVTLACGGKFYPVHKLVLSTCSDYFLQMFERTSCKHPIIILKDVQCREMEALLSYMYAGIVCVPQSDLTQLIMVAEALQIKGLAVPDETMCSNKRLSHTWSPTDNHISPHAKRLRQGDNGAGIQYPRFSNGQTMVKTQTATSMPSFSGVSPQTQSTSSSSTATVVKYPQQTVRPSYTTTRYSPYPARETERQQTPPKQIQTISLKEFMGMFKKDKQSDSKTVVPQSNGGEGAIVSQSDSQISLSDGDREILPETLVKVEVEEGTEPVQVDDFVPSHMHDSDGSQMMCHRDQNEITKSELNVVEGVRLGDVTVKEEIEVPQEAKETSDTAERFTGLSDKSHQSSSSQQQVTSVKSEKSGNNQTPGHQEVSPKEVSEGALPQRSTTVGKPKWEEDEDSSHPLDLSDTHKPPAQQTHPEEDSKNVTQRPYDNKLLKFPCPYCSFRSAQKSQLTKHMRTHTVENAFSCPYCPFRTSLHISLKEHMNTHKSGLESGQ